MCRNPAWRRARDVGRWYLDGWSSSGCETGGNGQHGVDLVGVSTRGRTRPARLLFPSVTDLAIRRYQTSFLVLRAADRPTGLVQALRKRLSKPESTCFS